MSSTTTFHFFQLTPSLAETLREQLTRAEWRLWSYLSTLEAFGDRFKDCPDLPEILQQAGLSKATFYRAMAKFEELGIFAVQWGRRQIRNLKGARVNALTPRQDDSHDDTNTRQESHDNMDGSRTFFSDQEIVSSMRQQSHQRDFESHPRDSSIYTEVTNLSHKTRENATRNLQVETQNHATEVLPAKVHNQRMPPPPISLESINNPLPNQKAPQKGKNSGGARRDCEELQQFVENLIQNPVFMQWYAKYWDKQDSPQRPHRLKGKIGAKAALRARPEMGQDLLEEFVQENTRRVETLNQRLAAGVSISDQELEEIQAVVFYSEVPLNATSKLKGRQSAVSRRNDQGAVSSNGAAVYQMHGQQGAAATAAGGHQQGAVGGGDAAVSGQQGAVSGQQAAVSDAVVSGQQAAVSGQQAVVSGDLDISHHLGAPDPADFVDPRQSNAPQSTALENPQAYALYQAPAAFIEALYRAPQKAKSKTQLTPHEQEAELQRRKAEALKLLQE